MKKAISVSVLAFLILSLVSCGNPKEKYAEKTEWASPKSYMFAVEVEGFDGENLKAGTFNFTSEIKAKNKIPAIFDVYVSATEYSKEKDVKPEEMVGSVGGALSDSVSVDIPAGNYVYLVYNPVIGNDPGNVIYVTVNSSGLSNKPEPAVKAEATPDPDERLRDAVEEYLAQAYGEDRPVRIRIQQSFVDAQVLSETEQGDGMPDNWAEIRDATVEVNSGMADAFPEGCGRQCAVLSLVDKNLNNLLVVKDGQITWDAFSSEEIKSPGYNPPTISLEEFNAIRTGMEYQEVFDIVGSRGTLMSESDSGLGDQYYTAIFSWDGEGSIGANANVMFQGGKVTSKAQFGLE